MAIDEPPNAMHRAVAGLRCIADDSVRNLVAAHGMSYALFQRLANPTPDDYEHGLTVDRLERDAERNALLRGAGLGTADRRLSDMAIARFHDTAEGAPDLTRDDVAETAAPAIAPAPATRAPDGIGDERLDDAPTDGFLTAAAPPPSPAPVDVSLSAFTVGGGF